jgi:mono/diheme cytochrome c family protein
VRLPRLVRLKTWTALIAVTLACGKKEFEPPEDGARVSEAASQFDAAWFDTIDWEDREQMLIDGASVYASTCRVCHAMMGEGGTAYAATRRLAVPSLVGQDWQYSDDLPAVRRLVFSGHGGGMPTHGIAGISLREIDAVSRYLLEQLRPEVLSGSAAEPPDR